MQKTWSQEYLEDLLDQHCKTNPEYAAAWKTKSRCIDALAHLFYHPLMEAYLAARSEVERLERRIIYLQGIRDGAFLKDLIVRD